MHKNNINPEKEKDIKKEKPLEIRKSIASEKLEIKNIHTKAFGKTKGPEIAELVNCRLSRFYPKRMSCCFTHAV